MDNTVALWVTAIVSMICGIFIVSLWIYGAMFAKREWLKALCIFMVFECAIYGAYGAIDWSKQNTSTVGLIILIIAYYIAYRLALFYKARKDRKLDSINNSNSKENLYIVSNQAKPLENEHIQDIIPEVEIAEVKDENKESKNDRIFCSFCGSKNVLNANFCHFCGKNISLDSKDFRESKEYAKAKTGILKYQGLFQIFIGLHGLFEIVSILLTVLSEFKTNPIEYSLFGVLLLLPFVYTFYQYFRYKKTWTYYAFLVYFGVLCILSSFGMLDYPFMSIIFILYCLILWYLYKSLRANI